LAKEDVEEKLFGINQYAIVGTNVPATKYIQGDTSIELKGDEEELMMVWGP
jgi:hypothetical protein